MSSQTFTSSGTFNVPTGVTSVNVLVVAGGGGGGCAYGGGGGGGGVIANSSFTVTSGASVTVTVGAGGSGSASYAARGANGGNSAFGSLTAVGGGGGDSFTILAGGASGGSGGGGNGSATSQTAGGSGTSGQGNAGGQAAYAAGGGGGGASAAGGAAAGSEIGGIGGNGFTSSISGSSQVYSGGGGGGTDTSGTSGSGGTGGGGHGGGASGAASASYYGGGGGGGSGASEAGGNGYQGIVIVSWIQPPNYVVGPASSTTNHVALFADATGALIKDGGALATVATSGAYTDLSGRPTALPPNGSAGGDLGGTYPNPTVAALHETSGPTQLVVGSVPDGTFLKRNGTALIGATPSGAGNVTGPGSATDGNLALFNGTSGTVIKDGGNPANGSLSWAFSTLQATRYTLPLVTGYPGSGTCTLDLSAQNNILITVTGDITFVGANRAAGFKNWLMLKNTSGAARTLTWPAWTASLSELPSRIANGQTLEVLITCTGTSVSDVVAYFSGPLPSGGAKFARLGKSSSASYEMAWYGPDEFNVLDYGAAGTNASVTTAAINAAIADLNAAGGGTLRIPYNPTSGNGTYLLSAALTQITVPCSILGDGVFQSLGGTMLIQTATNTPVLNIQTLGACLIANICFNGGGTQPAVLLTGPNIQSVIRECCFIGGEVGLWLDAGGLVIRDCLFGCNYGIQATNSGSLDAGLGLIQGCTFNSTICGVQSFVDGIQILGNAFGANQWAFIWQSTDGSHLADIWFEGNHVENQTVGCISLRGPATNGSFVRVIIADNEFAPASNTTTLDIVTGCSNWLSLVTITGNVFDQYENFAINLANASVVSIAGNVFKGSGTAVNIAASCSNGSCGSTNRFAGSGTSLVNNGGFVTT